jgi:hypothetical protein
MRKFWEVQSPSNFPDVDLAHHAAFASINPPGGYLGPTIASAATITLSAPAHKISGTAEITTINPPYTGFVGNVTLIALAAFTVATGGNIAKAGTAVANQVFHPFYDGSTWYFDSDAP